MRHAMLQFIVICWSHETLDVVVVVTRVRTPRGLHSRRSYVQKLTPYSYKFGPTF